MQPANNLDKEGYVRMPYYYGVGKDHICPICGKKFLVPYSPRPGGGSKWVYKYRAGNRNLYACSYSCYREVKAVI